MSTLMDTIKNNMQSAAQPAPTAPQASDTNITGQTQKLLQAKSGKAVGPAATPRISNVGEQVSNLQTTLAQNQLAQQAAVGTQQITNQVQNQEDQLKLAEQQHQFEANKLEADYTKNEEAMMDQYIKGQKQLNLQKDKSKFEQVGFKLRLQNQTYTDNLKREASRAQLDNDRKFKEEQARTIFAEEHDLFEDDLDFRSAIFSDKLAFNEQMANMSIDQAISMAGMASQQASQNSLFTGIGNITSGGSSAYSSYLKKQSVAEAQTDREGDEAEAEDLASQEQE